MQDRTSAISTLPPTRSRSGSQPAAESRQWDERLRRARLMKADADVAKTAALLVGDQPYDIRLQLAVEHEANLIRRAELRTKYGIATFTDRRVLATATARTTLATAAVTR